MAKEISLAYTASATLYAVIKTATGQYCVGTTPEAWNAAHWSTYAVALTEYATATGQYFADFPALPAGAYRVEIYSRAGGSPATSDGPPIAEGEIQWDGAAEVPLSSRLPTTGYTAPDNADIAAIKSRTDLIPNSPAAVGSTMILDLTQAVPTTNAAQTIGDSLNAARAQGFGKWVQSGTTLNLYAANGSTVVRTFNLNDPTNPTART